MADGYISQIKLPNEETYDFRDRNLKVYTGSCSTAAGTAIKDVVTDGIFTLEKGAVLFVNFTNTNSAAVGNLKLKINGEADTSAKPIKYLVNGNDPANIPGAGYLRANQTYMFRYDGTNWVADLNYYTYSNDFANKIGHYNNILARKAIAAESLIVGDETGYEKVASGVTFNLAYPIVWCTDAVNANASNYANMFLQHYDRNIATGAKSGFTSAANKVIYLIVTISGNIATIDSNIITDTLPSSDDGKVYISLGKLGAQSTGANYFFLYPVHSMFWYKNGAIREYSGASQYALAAPLSGISGADDLKAIEAISGTTGLLKKTAANTWTLDTSSYVTSSGITSVTIGATSPVVSSTATAQTGSSASTTISLADAYGDTKNPYGSKTKNYVLAAPSNANGVPSFRALVAADIPNKIQTNWELNAASGNSPALLFTRDGTLTDWKVFVNSGKLSFQSATNGTTWTERAYFKDNSGDFVANSFTGDGSQLTNLKTQNLTRPTSLNGVNDVTYQALINDVRANRLAFLPADQIIIEKTTDGGVTWEDAGVSDGIKTGLFSETRTAVYIPKINNEINTNCGLRITITAMKYNVPDGTPETQKYNYWNSSYVKSTERYNQIKLMYFWVSTANNALKVTVQKATGANPNNWANVFSNNNYGMTGWSGNDIITFGQGVFGGGTTQTGNTWNWRITLMTCGPNGSSTLTQSSLTSTMMVSEIRGYGDTYWTAGNKYAASDHLYSWDYNKNVTFPSNVTASKFIGALQGAATSADKWTTARTFTIGSTGKSVDGSGNVSWSLAEIGAAAASHSHSYLANTNTGAADRPIYITGNAASPTTYRMAGTNVTATTALAITNDLDTGIWYVSGTNSTDLYSQDDGVAYVEKYNNSWIHEIYGDYRTGQIAVRGKNNGTWQDWRKVLDETNGATILGLDVGSNNAATLTWGTTYTIAKINGTDIKFTTMVKPSYAFTDLTAHPTTLNDYGITDAKIASGVITLGSNTITPVTKVNGHTGNEVTVTASDLGLSTAMHFLGVSTTAITDGGTENPTIGGTAITTKTAGDVVIDNNSRREYVWSTTNKWEMLGFDASTAYSQTTSGNTFISSVSQATDGTVTAGTRALDTSGTWSGNAATATTATNLANNPSIQTSGTTQVTITAGGKTSSAYTIPYATSAGSATSATTATYIKCTDTRNTTLNPTDLTAAQGVRFDFKAKGTIDLTATDAYAGVMSFRPYASNSDWSGGNAHQLAFNSEGLHWRNGGASWGNWYQILDSNNTTTGTNNNATLTWNTTYTIAKINGADIKFTTMTKPTYAFSDLTSHPTTLSGYGITDAASSDHSHTLKIGNESLSVSTSEQTWSVHNILFNSTSIGTATSWDQTAPGAYYVASGAAFTGTGHPGTNQEAPYSYGGLYVLRAGNGGAAQIYISHNASNTTNKAYGIRYRSGWNVINNTEETHWVSWATILDDKNYSLFAWKRPSSITTGQVLISSGTDGTTATRAILNNTSKSALGWNSAGNTNADNLRFMTVNTLAYWNGAYSGTTSNLSVLGTVTTGTWNASVIGAAYGGTGQNTLQKSANVLINALDTGSSDLTANDYVITQYVGGGTTTTSYHRRPASKVINATLVKGALGTDSSTTNQWLNKKGLWSTPTAAEVGAITKLNSSTDNAIVRFDGTTGTIQDSGVIINDNDHLIAPAIRIANTYYGVSFGRTTGTPKETILHTGIKWVSSTHMPVIHITGYTYGLQSPVEFKIGFYIYEDKIGWSGATNMGSWEPDIYLFKDTRSETNYVAVGLAGSCYFLQLSVDLQDEMGKFNNVIPTDWSWDFLATEGTIPSTDDGTTCVKVPYKASIFGAKYASITTTSNAIAYYTNTTGTFGSKASANGALYATSENGALQWGTLPIAQGGTGATTAANARTNLGLGTMALETAANYLARSGGQMTGSLTWKDSTALPETTSGQYFLVIDAFANGGTTKWIGKANVLTSIGAAPSSHNHAASDINSGTLDLARIPTITNAKLANSKVIIAGNDVSLGGSLDASTLTSSLGLSSAMHYRGTSTTIPPASGTYVSGDVLVKTDTDEEYVYDGTSWRLLGSESSYKIKQEAVADPTAALTTSTTFIDTISQNTNGVISATKKTLPTASTEVAGIIKIGTSSTNAMAGNTTVTNVSYTAATDNNEYPILLKNSTGSDTTAAGVKFASGTNQQVTINPSTGTVSTRRLVINNSSSNGTVPDLVFSRTSWSYINIPDNDSAVLAIGRGTGDNASQKLIIQGSGTVRPGSDNTQSFGTSTRRWSQVYGVNFYGTFNGTSTYSQGLAKWAIDNSNLNNFVSNGALRYSWEGGNNSITSKPTDVNAFGVIAMKTAANWTGQILMSTDTEPGLYWRTNLTTETPSYGAWAKVWDSSNHRVFYGACTEAAGTAAKPVVCTNYDEMKVGDIITVKFDNTNTAASPTLNVNGKGSKSVKMAYSGGTADLSSYTQLAGIRTFIYDGTNWILQEGECVKQGVTDTTSDIWRPVMLGAYNSTDVRQAPEQRYAMIHAARNVKYHQTTGTLRAPILKTPKLSIEYSFEDKAHIQWNDTDSSIDFIFD